MGHCNMNAQWIATNFLSKSKFSLHSYVSILKHDSLLLNSFILFLSNTRCRSQKCLLEDNNFVLWRISKLISFSLSTILPFESQYLGMTLIPFDGSLVHPSVSASSRKKVFSQWNESTCWYSGAYCHCATRVPRLCAKSCVVF